MNKIILLVSICFLFLCSCGNDSIEGGPSIEGGKGGSLARFAINGNYLYTVDDRELEIFDISNKTPVSVGKSIVGFGIETIFPKGNLLFLGSETGMYIYDITSPTSPVRLSVHEHVYACDPVVADDNYAYVTLRSIANRCGRWQNQLLVVDIKDLKNPYTLKTYSMTSPKGLGIDGKNLFVCDNGLKVYDATDVLNLKNTITFGIDCHDVIPLNGNLLVIGSNALYQYEYKDEKMNLLSQLTILQ